jgi:hypothetical protein
VGDVAGGGRTGPRVDAEIAVVVGEVAHDACPRAVEVDPVVAVRTAMFSRTTVPAVKAPTWMPSPVLSSPANTGSVSTAQLRATALPEPLTIAMPASSAPAMTLSMQTESEPLTRMPA